ncbi:MAG: TRAP transporter small permease [Oscillospiraceae bacterium]|nr:TRAP transporter small permease [Oscillospiraceae bacterium]
MEKVRNAVGKVCKGYGYIGMFFCFIMVFVVAIDIILRKVSGNQISIKGSNEFSANFLCVVVMTAIPMFQAKRGHIWVNMFVDKFPTKFRSIWLGIIHVIECIVCLIFIYATVLKLQNFLSTGTTTDVLNMPKWPFIVVILIGFALYAIMLGIDAIMYFIEGAHGGAKGPRPDDGEAIA